MTILKYLSLSLIIPILLFSACKEYSSLDSIRVEPLIADGADTASSKIYVCDVSNDGLRQFQVIGTYEDDDTEDLSSEVTWEIDDIDSTGDGLSDTYPGLVKCNSAFGTAGLKATYTIESGDSNEEEGASATELTDSVIVDARNP